MPTLPWRDASLWLLAVVLLTIWLGTLDYRHLIPTDEGRCVEVVHKMFVSSDWVTVRYSTLKYLEKPPLQMRDTVLVYTLFGIGDWQARLFIALSSVVGIVFTVLAMTRWWGKRTAITSGLVFVSTPLWSIGSHFGSLDMGVAGCMTIVLGALLLAQYPGAARVQQRGWMWVC